MSVKLMEASGSLGEENVDLIVLDVDSGIDLSHIESLLTVSVANNTPVLLVGVLDSHENGSAVLAAHGLSDRGLKYGWLRRPFSGTELVHACEQLMGVSGERSVVFVSEDEAILPLFAAGFDNDEPPTVELVADYHHTIKEGLESSLDYEELLSFEIAGFSGDLTRGGVLVGEVSERRVKAVELEKEIEYLSELTSVLQMTSPEGVLLSNSLGEVSSSGVYLAERTGNLTRSGVSVVSRHRVGSGPSSVSAAGLSPELVNSIVGTARMLAESWDRLGLVARTEDRADRLERILFALFKDGLQGAASTLSRIPRASGLSGSLQVLGLLELLHMLRERGLRGRLELCVGEQAFVLYIDGGILEGIESLGSNTDAIMLRILYEQSIIDAETHARLSVVDDNHDGLGAPLEMRLRMERLVDDADLRAARRLHAQALFGGLFSEQRGNYAFIEILESSKQAWPVEGLQLNIDKMLLRLLRSGVIGVDGLVLDGGAGFILDPVRATSIRSHALTDSEREIALFFQAGETVRDARRQFGNAGEDVDQVLARLIRIELLKRHKIDVRRLKSQRQMRRSTQNSLDKSALEQSSSITLDFDLSSVVPSVEDPHQSPTAVSDWAIPIPGLLDGDGTVSEIVESFDDDGLWDALDVYFENDDMSEMSSELLQDTDELEQRVFGPGERDDDEL